MIEVRFYVTPSGKNVFEQRFESQDRTTQSRILVRTSRLAAGNFGDHKLLREGIWELRIDWGPGYRIYYGLTGTTAVLLLSEGEKRKQAADIRRATEYWKEFKNRRTKHEK